MIWSGYKISKSGQEKQRSEIFQRSTTFESLDRQLRSSGDASKYITSSIEKGQQFLTPRSQQVSRKPQTFGTSMSERNIFRRANTAGFELKVRPREGAAVRMQPGETVQEGGEGKQGFSYNSLHKLKQISQEKKVKRQIHYQQFLVPNKFIKHKKPFILTELENEEPSSGGAEVDLFDRNERLKFNPYWPSGEGFLCSYELWKQSQLTQKDDFLKTISEKKIPARTRLQYTPKSSYGARVHSRQLQSESEQQEDYETQSTQGVRESVQDLHPLKSQQGASRYQEFVQNQRKLRQSVSSQVNMEMFVLKKLIQEIQKTPLNNNKQFSQIFEDQTKSLKLAGETNGEKSKPAALSREALFQQISKRELQCSLQFDLDKGFRNSIPKQFRKPIHQPHSRKLVQQSIRKFARLVLRKAFEINDVIQINL